MFNLTPHLRKLLAKKTLTPTEVPVVFEVLSATPEGLQTALRHSNGALRRLALHAIHKAKETPAFCANSESRSFFDMFAEIPELFMMPTEPERVFPVEP